MSTAGPRGRWRWWRLDLAGGAVCLLFGAAVYALLVQPVARRNQADAAQQASIRQQQDQGAELAAKLRQFQEQLARLRRELGDTPLRLEPARSINRRLATISDLAGQCQLEIDQMQPGAWIRGLHYQTVPIVLSGTGSYERCATFLHRLHEEFSDIAVSALDLGAAAGSGVAPATFRFDLVWHTAPTEDGTAESP